MNMFLLLLLFFIKNIKSQTIDCKRNTPILISGECKLNYCSESQFISSYCLIANSIVKTQWLNNIIIYGNLTFRYINFGSFSNGDMVVVSSTYPRSDKRMFYGLKQNGRPLYSINGKETPYYALNANSNDGMFESESSVIKISSSEIDDSKEYFIIIGKLEKYAEIIDFYKNKTYYKRLSSFTSVAVKSYRHAFLLIDNKSSEYYYLFGFIGGSDNYSTDRQVYFQKHIFNSLDNFRMTRTYDSNFTIINNAFGYQVSCFKTKKELFICFYLTENNNKVNFIFHKFDNNLSNEITSDYQSKIDDVKIFCKCVHLIDEVGIFASYYPINNVNYPVLFLREFRDNDFQPYLSNSNDLISAIILEKSDLNINLLLNDIVKMNDNKIAFISTLSSKEILCIVIINFFGEKQYKIRYYNIPIYELYHYKIFLELRINNYNNFLAFSSSFCPNKICIKDTDEHYTGLIIYSYPNSKDFIFSIDDYLFNNNNITIERIEIDLKEQLNIDNNIFGYVLSKIKIMEIGSESNYKLYSSKNESLEITNNYLLEKDENIIIKYKGNLNYFEKLDKIIKYHFIVTEPEFNIFETYPEEIKGDNDKNYFEKEEYIGRLSYYTLILKNELSNNCTDSNCDFCLKSIKTTCITCKYEFKIYNSNKSCYNNKSYLKENGEVCSIEEILSNKCTKNLITENQLNKTYNELKNNYLTSGYKGENKIVETLNVIFQLSTLEGQKNTDYLDISSVDLGDCERDLIKINGIPEDMPLIILKTDIKADNLTKTYVQYEIYDPRNLNRLDLSICKNTISISAPIELDNSISSLYDNMKESGYNLFNENDSFYNDICSIYTSENGTDMTLNDRKNEIYNKSGKISLCQNGCELEYYNSTNRKAKCKCSPQINETKPSLNSSNYKFNLKIISDSFFTTLKYSNFLVLKCYKLAIYLSNIFTNIGRIFMTVIIILSLIISIIFCFYDNKKIDYYIKTIINNKKNKVPKKDKKTKNYKSKCSASIKLINIKDNIKNKNKNKNTNTKKSSPPKKDLNTKRKKDENINSIMKNLNSINRTNINIPNISVYNNDKNIKIYNKGKNNIKLNTIQENSSILNLNLNSHKNMVRTINNKYIYNFKNLNDQELNSLEYKFAIQIDKRTYFQYYWSLLKKKHLILFTFLPANDYNLIAIKICLFLVSFSLYFTINGFFFDDNTMHKIYVDKGNFNFIYQITQILYSSIVSSIINIILKQLCLSENNILDLKKENNIKNMINYSKSIRKCLTIKFIIFFILDYILLLFFWYFISCFCAVYKNTQIILIKDTLISFGISMLYPFGLNLIPGVFRIYSLRAQKTNKKCLYTVSKFIAII